MNLTHNTQSRLSANLEAMADKINNNDFDFVNCSNKSKEHVVSYMEGYQTALFMVCADADYYASKTDKLIKQLKANSNDNKN